MKWLIIPRNLSTIQLANFIKYAIVVILLLNIIAYDPFRITHSFDDYSDPTKRYFSERVFFDFTTLGYVVAAYTFYAITLNLFANFKWLQVFNVIFIGYSFNAFCDEAFFNPQVLGWNEIVVSATTVVIAIFKAFNIKNKLFKQT